MCQTWLEFQVGSPYLYSCSQDRRVVCVDKRMWRMLCELQLAAYAQSLSLCSGQLLCGTVGGKVVLLNPNNLSVVNVSLLQYCFLMLVLFF